jgi:uncharacterized protein (UPF0548 family)
VAREVGRLPARDVDRLGAMPFSYAPVGATSGSTYPAGFHRLDVEVAVGRGEADLRRAAETVMTWRMHAGAGLRVAAGSPRVHTGAVVLCRLGPLLIPCRVVWVVDEPTRTGFAYGTLPGHPEAGEESFVVRLDGDVVRLAVSAYSRPGLLVTRLAGPVGRWGQRRMLARYAGALR